MSEYRQHTRGYWPRDFSCAKHSLELRACATIEALIGRSFEDADPVTERTGPSYLVSALGGWENAVETNVAPDAHKHRSRSGLMRQANDRGKETRHKQSDDDLVCADGRTFPSQERRVGGAGRS